MRMSHCRSAERMSQHGRGRAGSRTWVDFRHISRLRMTMLRRIEPLMPAILSVTALMALPSLVSGQGVPPADPFAHDGSQNILHEEHFGIVNGKLAVGIPY